jgi:sugar-specific transcriptional regulator TrmB
MDLAALGLNQYESKAYAAVVSHGQAPAATIAKTSGVPYGRIYDVLAALEARGLVRNLPGKTKLFAPGDPHQLTELLHKRKADIAAAEAGLEHLKQVYHEHQQQPVEVATGKANFFRLMKTLHKKTVRDYSLKYTSQYLPEWVRSYERMAKEGMDLKSLARVDDETSEDVRTWLRHRNDIHEFPNKGVAISIGDKDVLIGLIHSNTTVVIRDEAFVDVMARLFVAAYEKAPSVTEDMLKSKRRVQR